MPYPGKGGMPPENPNGMNGEKGITGRELGATTLGLGIGVAEAAEGVEAEVEEGSEAAIELEPDESDSLRIGRALAGWKWLDHKGGAKTVHFPPCCYIKFLVLRK
jgi:hypothetical protein